MKKLILTTTLSILSFGVYAQECELQYKSELDVADCYEKSSFMRVQKNYQQLLNASKEQLSYNKNVLVELSKSQKLWLAYRDSYCDSYTNYHSEKYNHSNCIINLNEQRAKQLQEDLNAD